MNAQEMQKFVEKNNDKLQAAYDAAQPAAPEGDKAKPVKRAARGFAEFKEYINKNGRPRIEDKKVHVSIRLPESIVTAFRTEAAYTTKLSEYIMDGINSGKLKVPKIRKHVIKTTKKVSMLSSVQKR